MFGDGLSIRKAPALWTPNPQQSATTRREKMNDIHFKGMWNQFKGELKSKWGKFTNDDLMKIEGDYEKFKGVAQVRYADQMEEINRWVEEWYRSSHSKDPVGQSGFRN
jgi:uncharacterized protein YjbJ (UPF0337 family)